MAAALSNLALLLGESGTSLAAEVSLAVKGIFSNFRFMGALLAIPELIAVAVEGGAEALSIAGSASAIASGEGAALLGSLSEGAIATGGELGVSAAAESVLVQSPQVINQLVAIQGGVQAAAGAAGGIAYYLNPGELSAQASSTSGGGRPGGFNNPHTKPNMALQPFPGNNLEHGVPGIPDWVLNLVPELPSLQDLIYRITNGILSSYYYTGRAVVQRTLSEEMQRLLEDLSRGFSSTLESIGQSDPVGGLIQQIQNAHRYFRAREDRLLLEGGAPLPIGDVAGRAGTAIGDVAGRAGTAIGQAGSAISQAGQAVAESVRNIVVDVANLPMDGYNTLAEGVHRLGQWIQFSGSDGGTSHYSTPMWILYVLQELEKELPKIPRTSLKRKLPNGFRETPNNRQKKARTRKSTSSKTASSNKKRRGRSTRSRSSL